MHAICVKKILILQTISNSMLLFITTTSSSIYVNFARRYSHVPVISKATFRSTLIKRPIVVLCVTNNLHISQSLMNIFNFYIQRKSHICATFVNQDSSANIILENTGIPTKIKMYNIVVFVIKIFEISTSSLDIGRVTQVPIIAVFVTTHLNVTKT